MGWLTTEELVWNPNGKLATNGPMGYKIPAIADTPIDFRTHLVENRSNPEQTVYNSKAVGEPPFMLGMSVWSALRDAAASVADHQYMPHLDAPATPERVLWAVQDAEDYLRTKKCLSDQVKTVSVSVADAESVTVS